MDKLFEGDHICIFMDLFPLTNRSLHGLSFRNLSKADPELYQVSKGFQSLDLSTRPYIVISPLQCLLSPLRHRKEA